MNESASNLNKHAYTLPCASVFRDAVLDLARVRGVNVADLARSVVLMVPAEIIEQFEDPGEPDAGDRETVVLKSGAAKGRPWRRKPRLQVRMAPGYTPTTIRKALGMALALAKNDLTLDIKTPQQMNEQAKTPELREEIERLQSIIAELAFEPLSDGIQSRDDALHVLGFPPGALPPLGVMRARFRTLASIHHPDGKLGSHQRMSQLNAAMEYLRRGNF